MSHLIEVKNLQTEFKQEKGTLKAANGVSYYLDPGEIVAFVGESGSGKSVTQYSSLQLIPSPPGKITGGEIIFEGKNLLEYLNEAGYKSEWVVVERNFEIIPRENLGNVTIQDNDEIEVLRFVGGG